MRALAILACLSAASLARAQSPELSLREFASGQIKKGVRSIGMGGDGATWGNYSLVYRDAGTALFDAGITSYDNGNSFTFTAAGFTTPKLWRGLALYAIALSQTATSIHVKLTSPGLGSAVPVVGDGANQAVFVKLAMPLPRGFAIGVMLAYEVSTFSGASELDGRSPIRYETRWRPSGGVGVSWNNRKWLVGARVILNHDEERRTDARGSTGGLARSYEFRLGASYSPWKGALVDAGGTLLDRSNAIANTEKLGGGANLGFEQAFWDRALVFRGGVDECTFGLQGCTATAGVSTKVGPVNLDVAYLYNLGDERIGKLFGDHSHSILMTLTLDYVRLVRR